MYTVLVCGGRNYTDSDKVYYTLDSVVDKEGLWEPVFPGIVTQELLIVSGGARGADSLARDWAGERGARINEYLPNWSRGIGAPCDRNQQIFDNEAVNLVIAFGTDGNTSDVLWRARKARIEVKGIK